MDVCKVLAREIVASRKAQNRLHSAKAHMNSVEMQMKNQLGQLKASLLYILGQIMFLRATGITG